MRVLVRAGRWLALPVVIVGTALSLGAQSMAATPGGGAVTAARGASHGTVRPHAIGELDCNGLSPIQRPVKASVQCLDPRGEDGGRFYENGHYIGHDEPSIRFLSGNAGSGNDVTFHETLPTDPSALPTVAHPGKDVTHWFELSIAPWFSIDVCDPNSAPLAPCTPRSDANAPTGSFQGGGAAFVELQFYAPGFAPFADNISCDNTHWCSALTIDSLECTGNGSGPCNQNCVEPVNFGFIQTNGVPAGPPSSQLSDNKTFTPNSHTLLMNPGDKIIVHMFDAPLSGGGHALEAQETDVTTGTSGFMIASAANGFMNTDPFSCMGTPFNFEPEYNTARAANIIPWGIGPYMINSEYEIGHFEPCTSVSGRTTTPLGKIRDVLYKHCAGPYETAKDTGAKFEPNDSPCFKFGDTHHGLVPPNQVTGCDVFDAAIGDLEYDGTNYYPDWPDSLTAGPFPSPFLQQQPTSGGEPYHFIQFMTDTTATEFNTGCNLVTGSGCVLPPKGPGNFYPFWTLASVGGTCVWEFGNMTNGNDFGGDGQYGSVGPNTIGAFAGPVMRAPRCSRR